jgi:hypothetical protein
VPTPSGGLLGYKLEIMEKDRQYSSEINEEKFLIGSEAYIEYIFRAWLSSREIPDDVHIALVEIKLTLEDPQFNANEPDRSYSSELEKQKITLLAQIKALQDLTGYRHQDLS